MDKERSFNFKLFVPPRLTSGPVSSVIPQETKEKYGDFMNKSTPQQQSCTKVFETSTSMPYPSSSVVAPAKPNRKDYNKRKVAPLQQDENYKPGQLYCTLLDEVEKMKCWKVKVDFEVVQKEAKLKENKRIIETQRKAIQELQFGNESLSIKLEEQISENEDLRNKNNATRNLCNILKDTFERSAEKMHLFESEREETHQLFIENSETIQKMIEGFKSLSLQVEADQHEMMKVKDGLLQFVNLKEKYHQQYTLKEEEVATFQQLLQEKENEYKKSVHDLEESQDRCRQLQDSTNEQKENLKILKTEQESILRKLAAAQHDCAESKTSMQAIQTKLEESKAEYETIIQEKDLHLQKLSQDKTQIADKLERSCNTVQELQKSLDLEKQRVAQQENLIIETNEKLEQKNAVLGETLEKIEKENEKIKHLDEELEKKSNSFEILKDEMNVLQGKMNELNSNLSSKTKEAQLAISKAQCAVTENELLRKSLKAAEKAEEDLIQKCKLTELEVQELEELLRENKKKAEEHTHQLALQKEAYRHLQEDYEALSCNFKKLESEKKVVEEQFENGSCTSKAIQDKMKVSEESSLKLRKEIKMLEDENKLLREEVDQTKAKIQEHFKDVNMFQKRFDKKCDHWHKELTKKEKAMKAMETKVGSLKRKWEIKFGSLRGLQKENNVLKKEIEAVTMKSAHLENQIKAVQEESEKMENQIEENKTLEKDLEYKSAFVEELENELHKLREAAEEAIKNKEDAELKCQHKTADMVAVMEKHKNHYVKMVEEKEAELEEIRKKELEFETQRRTLIKDTKKQKAEIDELKKKLAVEIKEKENLEKEMSNLKKEESSAKSIYLSRTEKNPVFDFIQKQGQCSETPKSYLKSLNTDVYKRAGHKTENAPFKKTESDTASLRSSRTTTTTHKGFQKETPKSTSSGQGSVGGVSKIKTYRVRTPPSTEKETGWSRSFVNLDPKSDSSDKTDVLFVPNQPKQRTYIPSNKINTRKLTLSPSSLKSPGNSLKLAAMKRMRDAGWTTVTGFGKKKKNNEAIFA